MELFENPRKKFLRKFTVLLPVLFLIMVSLVFSAGINYTSGETLQKEQQILEQALRNGTVRSYALNGRYPESLDQLLSEYHISYDTARFVVEYIPNGSNLFPSISVIPLSRSVSDRKEAVS